MTHPRAFTLIELLVVITIIVVLLALLAPALDKAVYQAELARCGAQLHSIVGDTQQYAMAFRRAYPYRGTGLGNQQTTEITEQGRGWDLRPIVKGYVTVNNLTCALSGKVDIEASKPDTTFVFGSYDYWAGWRYSNDAGSTGMLRVGDRLMSSDDADRSIKHSFNLLASDRDVIGIRDQVQGSHPDTAGVLRQVVLQEATNAEWGVGGTAVPWGTITIAAWVLRGSHTRGSVDRNFGYQDGAVIRLSELVVKADGQPDDRLVTAPYNSDGAGYQGTSAGKDAAYYTALPAH
jgi:prepilin-type N-terminal cleavage/methylation domain-containing protein